MVERKTYYVSLDKETITEVSIPDTAEYEIEATQEELAVFRTILDRNKKENFWFGMKNLVITPFAEDDVEDKREQMDDNLMAAFQFIYDHGTEKTKRDLEEARIITK